MIVRMGLNPADIAPGKPIKAIGAPRRDDPNAFFLKAIILPDGRRFSRHQLSAAARALRASRGKRLICVLAALRGGAVGSRFR